MRKEKAPFQALLGSLKLFCFFGCGAAGAAAWLRASAQDAHPGVDCSRHSCHVDGCLQLFSVLFGAKGTEVCLSDIFPELKSGSLGAPRYG